MTPAFFSLFFCYVEGVVNKSMVSVSDWLKVRSFRFESPETQNKKPKIILISKIYFKKFTVNQQRCFTMFTKLNRVLLASGLAIASAAMLSPAAFADEGGVAGSAAFNLDTVGNVLGVATAASVGKNGASAWAFQDGTSNSAGALGSAGVIDITTFNATSVGNVNDSADPNLVTAQENGMDYPDIKLGTEAGDEIINN